MMLQAGDIQTEAINLPETMQPYPSYKPSGLDWLGEVPEHWELRRTKTVLMQRVEKGHPNESLLAATQTKGVVRKELYENRTVLAMKDLHLLKLVHVKDFVISLRSFQGGIEYARERGIISPAYTVLYPSNRSHHGYLAKLFKSEPYVQNLTLFVTGIRQGQNIDYERLSRSSLPLPPLDEQRAIVRFLDHADHRIRRYIRAKERLTELLEEEKQAIIHQAVTGQIDVQIGKPYPAYKDSGVEWLGKVPEHWGTKPLKAFVQVFGRIGFRGYSTSDLVDPGTGAITLSPSNLRHGEMNYSKCTYLSWRKYHESPEIKVHDRDLLFVKTGASYGKVAVVSRLPEKATINPQLVVIKNIRGDITFIHWALEAFSTQAQIETAVIGGTIPTLSQSKIGRLRFALPVVDEQRPIVSWVKGAIAPIATAVSKTAIQIELLREYRTRLIADVVTGKLDVREAAVSLPDQVNAPEPPEAVGKP